MPGKSEVVIPIAITDIDDSDLFSFYFSTIEYCLLRIDMFEVTFYTGKMLIEGIQQDKRKEDIKRNYFGTLSNPPK